MAAKHPYPGDAGQQLAHPGAGSDFLQPRYGHRHGEAHTAAQSWTALVHGADRCGYGGIKKQTARPRPYEQYASIKPCLPREDSQSFPSGHSTWYSAASELLADLLPERRERLLAVGFHAGASRVMCGVHFPTDVEAGRRLGAAAALQIIASPQWQALRSDPALQKELRLLRSVPQESLPLLVR